MDYKFEQKWLATVKEASDAFGQPVDLQAILFLIGLQELGKGSIKYSKDDKMAIMHIATCRVLEPFGYYQFTGLDQDGWPHFEKLQDLPPLSAAEQERLMKEAIIDYLDY